MFVTWDERDLNPRLFKNHLEIAEVGVAVNTGRLLPEYHRHLIFPQ